MKAYISGIFVTCHKQIYEISMIKTQHKSITFCPIHVERWAKTHKSQPGKNKGPNPPKRDGWFHFSKLNLNPQF